MKLKQLFILFIILLSLFVTNISYCNYLKWDYNTSADYYEVCWGVSSGDYSEGCSGKLFTTSYELVYLPKGKVYYFAVKASNYCHDESTGSFSKETSGQYFPLEFYKDSNNNSNNDSNNDFIFCFISSQFNL